MAKTSRKWIELENPLTNNLTLSALHIYVSDFRINDDAKINQLNILDSLTGQNNYISIPNIWNKSQENKFSIFSKDVYDSIIALMFSVNNLVNIADNNKIVFTNNENPIQNSFAFWDNNENNKKFIKDNITYGTSPTFETVNVFINQDTLPMGINKNILPSEYVISATLTGIYEQLKPSGYDGYIQLNKDNKSFDSSDYFYYNKNNKILNLDGETWSETMTIRNRFFFKKTTEGSAYRSIHSDIISDNSISYDIIKLNSLNNGNVLNINSGILIITENPIDLYINGIITYPAVLVWDGTKTTWANKDDIIN